MRTIPGRCKCYHLPLESSQLLQFRTMRAPDTAPMSSWFSIPRRPNLSARLRKTACVQRPSTKPRSGLVPGAHVVLVMCCLADHGDQIAAVVVDVPCSTHVHPQKSSHSLPDPSAGFHWSKQLHPTAAHGSDFIQVAARTH